MEEKPTFLAQRCCGSTAQNETSWRARRSWGMDVFSTNATDLVIDIDGYFAPGASGGPSLYTSVP